MFTFLGGVLKKQPRGQKEHLFGGVVTEIRVGGGVWFAIAVLCDVSKAALQQCLRVRA